MMVYDGFMFVNDNVNDHVHGWMWMLMIVNGYQWIFMELDGCEWMWMDVNIDFSFLNLIDVPDDP